jgi:hypothetical protein
MTPFRFSFSAAVLGVLFASVLLAQTAPGPEKSEEKKQDAAGGSDSHTKAAVKDPVQSGIDRPAILVPADSDEVTTKILLRGIDSKPAIGDLETGLLVSTLQPSFLVRPSVTLLAEPVPGKAGEFLTELKIDGLVAFGESSAPLLYKGRQVEVLRFFKPGLIAKPPLGDSFVVRENSSQPSSLLLVLENPSTFVYKSVRARLRFDNQDVCLFAAENFGQKPAAVVSGIKLVADASRSECPQSPLAGGDRSSVPYPFLFTGISRPLLRVSPLLNCSNTIKYIIVFTSPGNQMNFCRIGWIRFAVRFRSPGLSTE